MGGSFVYPGGRVDQNDVDLVYNSCCKGISPEQAHQMLAAPVSPEKSLAYWVAGIRELFEEAGILLAYDHAGSPLILKNSRQRQRFLNYRNLLQQGKLTIRQLVEEEELMLALDRLHYYAHWITPEARSERFDTRFFVACHPEGQEATYDQKETTIGTWLTPRKALEENLEGNVALSPPTLKTLEDLSGFGSIDEVLKSLGKDEIWPILPVHARVSDDTVIIFPWDSEYEIFQRGEIPANVDHGTPSRTGDNTTRLIQRKGHWLPYCRRI